ncbi:MAG: 16S rRNA (cytosine(967)-C(5))-methyltransferase RsmB [bacterium]
MSAPPTARNAALQVLEQVERGDAYASTALDRVLSASTLSPADRGLATELTYGVLRHQTRLDRAVAAHADRGLKRAHPMARRALRLAAYQLLMLDRIPASAAIDEAVEAVRLGADQRTAGFVNAVLRKLSDRGEPPFPAPRDSPRAYLRDAASLPPWIAKQLLARFGPEDAIALGQALIERPPLTVRANRLQIDRDALAQELRDTHPGADCRPTPFAPDGLHLTGVPDPVRTAAHRRGALEVQDEASQLVAELLAPRPGQRILDACAGRGGKTLHLASLTNNQATLVAADSSATKLDELRNRLAHAGAPPPVLITADLSQPCEALTSQPPFDAVLLDAPCTGLGVLRRHPEAKWRLRPEQLPQLAALQSQLLDNVARLVRPGGVLVYAVCTLTIAEGPDQLAAFLARHDHFAPEPPPSSDVNWTFLLETPTTIQTLPHKHNTDAFFLSRLRRRP